MKIHNSSNDKGIAIFITLMLLFLLSLAAIAVLLTTYNYNNICEGQIKRTKAINLAESGINYAYWKLRTDPTSIITSPGPTDTTISISGTNVVITVTVDPNPSGQYIINSRVDY
jgi:Tfp pilus assembly protein PilX